MCGCCVQCSCLVFFESVWRPLMWRWNVWLGTRCTCTIRNGVASRHFFTTAIDLPPVPKRKSAFSVRCRPFYDYRRILRYVGVGVRLFRTSAENKSGYFRFWDGLRARKMFGKRQFGSRLFLDNLGGVLKGKQPVSELDRCLKFPFAVHFSHQRSSCFF